jgi:hypothetical protein
MSIVSKIEYLSKLVYSSDGDCTKPLLTQDDPYYTRKTCGCCKTAGCFNCYTHGYPCANCEIHCIDYCENIVIVKWEQFQKSANFRTSDRSFETYRDSEEKMRKDQLEYFESADDGYAESDSDSD